MPPSEFVMSTNDYSPERIDTGTPCDKCEIKILSKCISFIIINDFLLSLTINVKSLMYINTLF